MADRPATLARPNDTAAGANRVRVLLPLQIMDCADRVMVNGRWTVEDGVVTLQGSPETAALGQRIVHKIRHVQGVVAVRDRLSYPDVYPIVAGPVL